MISEETRNKMGISKIGNKYALGFHHTKEARDKMSLLRKGKKHSYSNQNNLQKFCVECNSLIPPSPHYARKKYCCKKCEGRFRRKQSGYKEQINSLRLKWEERNKEHLLAYRREWEHKNYLKRKAKTDRWIVKNPHYHRDYHKREKAKEREDIYKKTEHYKGIMKKSKERFAKNHPGYWREIFNKNPERNKENHRKYRKSNKGMATRYKIYDSKRRRNTFYLGTKTDLPSEEVISMLRERDKVCFYCGCDFNLDNSKDKSSPSFDHINPELPLSNFNAVICCKQCNSSKKKFEVLSWLKYKGYEPSNTLLELLEKQKEFLLKNLENLNQ